MAEAADCLCDLENTQSRLYQNNVGEDRGGEA